MVREIQASDTITLPPKVDFIKKSITSAEDKIELQNLEMIIPEKTVKESSTISFEITPHNVKFLKLSPAHFTIRFIRC